MRALRDTIVRPGTMDYRHALDIVEYATGTAYIESKIQTNYIPLTVRLRQIPNSNLYTICTAVEGVHVVHVWYGDLGINFMKEVVPIK